MNMYPVYPQEDETICCKHCDDLGDGGVCTHCGKWHHPVTVWESCEGCYAILPKDPISKPQFCDDCAKVVADRLISSDD